VESGKLRALAVASKERLKVMPDVPTMAEAGYPSLEGGPWFGLVAPAATPRAIIDQLNAEVRKAFAGAAERDRFLNQGMLLPITSPEEFGKFMQEESARWGKIIRDAGIKM
jgi:tripartite-type tricarboxylate transporter receptor subunit TctC